MEREDMPERRRRTVEKAEDQVRWRAENAVAIASINAFIDRHGLLARRLRYHPDRE
jgi:post-segregation antitoxin (ccd killing protein)